SRDEIGVLTDGFRYMLDTIRERDKKLNSMNATLEKEVEKRTKDLEFTIRQLQKANELKKTWIQNIGHELRTPIHAITSFTEISKLYLNKKPVDHDKLLLTLDKIDISGERLI